MADRFENTAKSPGESRLASAAGVPVGYFHRVALTVTVTLTALALILTLWFQIHTLLLGFAGVLLAIFLYVISRWIVSWTHMYHWLALLITCLALIALCAGIFWLLGARIMGQMGNLNQQIPTAIQRLEDYLNQSSMGRWTAQHLGPQLQSIGQQFTGNTVSTAGKVTWGITEVFVFLFVGLFGAINPKLYRDGFAALFPPSSRPRVAGVLHEIRYELWWWLVGQFVAMVFIGVVTAVADWIVGIPLALSLGIIAALLNFVPNFGPILAAVPAVLIALLKGPQMALWVILIYTAIQILQNHVVTPLVQQRAVNLPPVILMMAQIFMYYWDGALGMVMAPPLAVVVMILVRMLYLDKIENPPATSTA